jgi:hypothetical protein
VDRTSEVTIEQSMWRTDKLKDPALRVWLSSSAPQTGDPALDRALAADLAKLPGLPLKVVTTITSVADSGDSAGKPSVSTRTMEVTQLGNAEVPSNWFDLPPNYRETQIVPGSEIAGSKP